MGARSSGRVPKIRPYTPDNLPWNYRTISHDASNFTGNDAAEEIHFFLFFFFFFFLFLIRGLRCNLGAMEKDDKRITLLAPFSFEACLMNIRCRFINDARNSNFS